MPLAAFYPAEPYHQDYVRRHPDSTYVILNDLPKLARLREAFPALTLER
jgi:peptide-methionine (S)-S-oxide reductase